MVTLHIPALCLNCSSLCYFRPRATQARLCHFLYVKQSCSATDKDFGHSALLSLLARYPATAAAQLEDSSRLPARLLLGSSPRGGCRNVIFVSSESAQWGECAGRKEGFPYVGWSLDIIVPAVKEFFTLFYCKGSIWCSRCL